MLLIQQYAGNLSVIEQGIVIAVAMIALAVMWPRRKR